MKIFLDTANIDHIREINDWGILDGVTTNPSLIAKEGRDFKTVVREICAIVEGPVSAETVAPDAAGMVEEGKDLAAIHDNVIVKVPLTAEGLKATKRLADYDIPTNVTLCFSATQALLAAKAGAAMVSPFVGRLDDVSADGMGLIGDIRTIFDNYDYQTEVLVASVRHPLHVLEAATMGADICTIPHKVALMLVKHPLTDLGIERFLADWRDAVK